MRTPVMAGNWKMYKTIGEAVSMVADLKARVAGVVGVDVVVCPPFTAVAAVAKEVEGSNIAVGAQGVFWEKEGAFTGEVSPTMVRDAGARYVIIGHSERRGRFGTIDEALAGDLIKVFGDTDASVNRKAKAALAHGLIPILCVGELLSEREGGQTDVVVSDQVCAALAGLEVNDPTEVILAYEPVWAIGTGKVCDAEEADRVIGLTRATVAKCLGDVTAQAMRILYGGSVKPDNITGLMAQPQIDGGLVGGASLRADSFETLVKACV